MEEKTLKDKLNDPVNHPSHYTDGNIEVITYIQDKGLIEGFCLGNVIKYVSRSGKKLSSSQSLESKKIQDLEKAAWYLNYYINYLKEMSDK